MILVNPNFAFKISINLSMLDKKMFAFVPRRTVDQHLRKTIVKICMYKYIEIYFSYTFLSTFNIILNYKEIQKITKLKKKTFSL